MYISIPYVGKKLGVLLTFVDVVRYHKAIQVIGYSALNRHHPSLKVNVRDTTLHE